MEKKKDVRYINTYVSGTSAYWLEPAPKKAPVKLPKQRKRKKNLLYLHLDPLAAIGVVTALVMLVMMVVGHGKLQTARNEAAVMESYVATLQQENADLEDTYASGYDLEEIERIALAMGMVPAEQAPTLQVEVTVPQEPESVSLWESVCNFLTGLFA